MKLNVYAIFDSAACVYDRPICFRADGEALRFFTAMAVSDENVVGKSPKDFSFYKIGEFHDDKGEIVPLDRFCMATAEEVIAQSRQIEAPLKAVEDSYGGTA